MRVLAQQLLSGALENARFGICVLDSSGRIIIMNRTFGQKVGMAQEHALGQSYLLLFQKLGHAANFHQLFGVGHPEMSVETMLTDEQGRKSFLLLQSSALEHESGETFRVVSAFDVTDYGVTRDRFSELHRQMDAINNSVVIVDARAKDMPITYVNAHFERMTGYARNEVIGRNCRFLQGDERDQDARHKLRVCIEKRESCHVTLRNFRKDGSLFHNELFISPVFDEAGELTHFIGVQHETRDRQMQGALVGAER